MPSVTEAKEKLRAHRRQEEDAAKALQRARVEGLHAGTQEFIAAMVETFPEGIEVEQESVVGRGSILPQGIGGFFHRQYVPGQHRMLVLSHDHSGEPGVTIAMVNKNCLPSNTAWLAMSIDVRTVADGMGFHLFVNKTHQQTPESAKLMEFILSEVGDLATDLFERTNKILSYAEPMLEFAQKAYILQVDRIIQKRGAAPVSPRVGVIEDA